MNPTNSPQRINKYLALELGVSRREADKLIERGRVSVNGKTAVLGDRASERDTIYLDDKPIHQNAKLVYIALNKPVGYVCSRKKQGETPTIYSLVPKELQNLKTVGRLDKDSSGLILLTNDGDFTLRMTHPRYKKTKIYNIKLSKPLEALHQQMISDYGVDLPDGKSQLILEKISDDRKSWQVTMHEGRNRQIRRTFAALDYRVTDLHRIQFGNYSLGDIRPGKHQVVNIQ
jgi:pseudouridine synthase